ncbi:MAG: extracellular solute-binding protein [Erysipelotrichaceae bacterium]|nr:extracellular solute-binding protein [Erysipelotrichaceae bacterium]
MKKVLPVLLFVGIFTLISCGKIDANQVKLDEAHEALSLPLSDDEMKQVIRSFRVSSLGLYETTISWTSNNPDVVRIEDLDESTKTYFVNIIRPENGMESIKVIVTAELAITSDLDATKTLTKTKEFEVTVLPLGDWGIISNDDQFDTSKPVEITFWHRMSGVYQQLLDEHIVEFQDRYPNIKVTQFQAGSTYDTLQTAVMIVLPVGGQPNLVEAYGDHVAGYNKSQAITPLNSFISHPDFGLTQADIDDFIPAFFEDGRSYDNKGSMYSMPLSKRTEALYYNKTFFDANNLIMPKNPTWDDLARLSKSIKELPGQANSRPIGYDYEDNMFISGSEQLGIPYASFALDGQYQLNFNNQTSIDMVKYWRDLTQEGLLTTRQVSGDVYTSDLLKNGTIFMAVSSTASARNHYSAAFETAVVPAPQFDLSNKKMIQQGPNITMFKNSDKQEMIASWLFMKFLTEAEQTAEWSTRFSYLPVRYSAYNTAAYQSWKNSVQPRTIEKVFLDVIEMVKIEVTSLFATPTFYKSSICQNIIRNLVVEVIRLPILSDEEIERLFQEAYHLATQ